MTIKQKVLVTTIVYFLLGAAGGSMDAAPLGAAVIEGAIVGLLGMVTAVLLLGA